MNRQLLAIHHRAAHTARGFTMVTTIFILVVLAALGTAIATLSVNQHLATASEVSVARA